MTASGGAGFTDPAMITQEWLDAKVDELQELAGNAYEMQRSIDALTIDMWSPGRELRLSIASTGLLERIELTEAAMGLPPNVLSRLVLSTMGRALAALQDEVTEIARSAGPGLAQDSTVSVYREAFEGPISKINGSSIN